MALRIQPEKTPSHNINLQEQHAMPYQANADLPEPVRQHLPQHAQDIYREAFNHAWEEYATPKKRRSTESREEVSHKVAWSAVERKYHKEGSQWVEGAS